MTSRADIIDNANYLPLLDHGFCGLIDSMGSDSSVVDAARLSYAKGTKKVNEDRGLIRYLMSHRHTSPFEMCSVKFHLKIPILVMRQLVRHRTSALNEMSARYSILPSEFYVPDFEHLAPQSTTNNQGRAQDGISENDKHKITNAILNHNNRSYDLYAELLNDIELNEEYGIRDDLEFGADYPGLTRELSRMVLPVNVYTELVWNQSLHNLLHLLKLRTDKHAQYEIRVLADAMYHQVKKLFPLCVEAWEDYVRDAQSLSRMEHTLLKDLIDQSNLKSVWAIIKGSKTEAEIMKHYGLNKRELNAFKEKIGVE